MSQKKTNLKNSFKKNDERLSKILEKLDLEGIESWTEQQQYSVKKALRRISTLIYSEFEGAG